MAKVTMPKKQLELEKDMSIKELFQNIKSAVRTETITTVGQRAKAIDRMLKRANKTGQTELVKKLNREKIYLEKRKTLIDVGYDKYVMLGDLEKYSDAMAEKESRRVAIVELNRYMRDIPDDVVEKINQAKKYFDEFVIMYTDFSSNIEKLEKEREIEKDPIVFGIITAPVDQSMDMEWSETYFVVADWQDEYCDLDLATYIDEYSKTFGVNKKDVVKDANNYVVD